MNGYKQQAQANKAQSPENHDSCGNLTLDADLTLDGMIKGCGCLCKIRQRWLVIAKKDTLRDQSLELGTHLQWEIGGKQEWQDCAKTEGLDSQYFSL